MTQLVRVAVLAFTLIITGVFSARLIGAAQAPPPIADIFTNADGSQCAMPCLFGTNAREAQQAVTRLKVHPLTSNMTSSDDNCFRSSAFLSNRNLNVYIRCSKNNIITFSLDKRLGLAPYPPVRAQTPFHTTTLAEVVSILGSPDYVDTVTAPFGSTLIYSKIGVIVSFQRPYPANPRLVVNPNETLLWIMMQENNIPINKMMQRWIGFSTNYSRRRFID